MEKPRARKPGSTLEPLQTIRAEVADILAEGLLAVIMLGGASEPGRQSPRMLAGRQARSLSTTRKLSELP